MSSADRSAAQIFTFQKLLSTLAHLFVCVTGKLQDFFEIVLLHLIKRSGNYKNRQFMVNEPGQSFFKKNLVDELPIKVFR